MKKNLVLFPLICSMVSCATLTANQGEDRISLLEKRIEAMEDKITEIEENIYKTNVRIDNISKNRVIYNKAFKLYNLKRLNQAVEAFDHFIDNFPDNDLTDNAYFWKGKAYFELGRIEKAKEEFKKLMDGGTRRKSGKNIKRAEGKIPRIGRSAKYN